jgi:prolyl-tRNA synthetase
LEAGNIMVKLDDREERPGPKFFEWEKKGVPIRIEIGPKDVAKQSVVVVRRDTGGKESVKIGDIARYTVDLLDDIQKSIFERARKFRDENTREIDSYDEFKKVIDEEGGFILSHWCGSRECEARVKADTKATIRCIPFEQKKEAGKCVRCSQKSGGRVVFARAY